MESSWIETEDLLIRSFGDGFPCDMLVHIRIVLDLLVAKQMGETFIPGDSELKDSE